MPEVPLNADFPGKGVIILGVFHSLSHSFELPSADRASLAYTCKRIPLTGLGYRSYFTTFLHSASWPVSGLGDGGHVAALTQAFAEGEEERKRGR
jgi:hypothetical protein